jgi:hypothetical protein
MLELIGNMNGKMCLTLKGVIMICDWCGEKSSVGYNEGKDNHILKSFANRPIICNGCYKKMRKQKVLKIIHT